MTMNLKTEWENGNIESIKRLIELKKEQLEQMNQNATGEQISDRLYSFMYNEIGIYTNEIEKYIDKITE